MPNPVLIFDCPNCGVALNYTTENRPVVENGEVVYEIKQRKSVCPQCKKGLKVMAFAFAEPLSEHEIRQNAQLFRLAEEVRRGEEGV